MTEQSKKIPLEYGLNIVKGCSCQICGAVYKCLPNIKCEDSLCKRCDSRLSSTTE